MWRHLSTIVGHLRSILIHFRCSKQFGAYCSFDSVYLFNKTKRVTIVLVTIPAAGTPPAGERLNQPWPMREARRMIRWGMRKQDGRGNCCCTRVGKRCRRNHSTRIWFNHYYYYSNHSILLVLKQGQWLTCAFYEINKLLANSSCVTNCESWSQNEEENRH